MSAHPPLIIRGHRSSRRTSGLPRDTTFISFHDAWARKKGLPDDSGDVEGASFSTLSGGEIQVESTSLGVQATLRVPTGSKNKLPEVHFLSDTMARKKED